MHMKSAIATHALQWRELKRKIIRPFRPVEAKVDGRSPAPTEASVKTTAWRWTRSLTGDDGGEHSDVNVAWRATGTAHGTTSVLTGCRAWEIPELEAVDEDGQFSPLPLTHTRTQNLVWVPWCDSRKQRQLSSAETSIDWRSARPVVLDIPSGAIFSLPGKHALRSSSRATALIAAAPPPSWVLSARTSFSPLSLDSSAGEKVYFLHDLDESFEQGFETVDDMRRDGGRHCVTRRNDGWRGKRCGESDVAEREEIHDRKKKTKRMNQQGEKTTKNERKKKKKERTNKEK